MSKRKSKLFRNIAAVCMVLICAIVAGCTAGPGNVETPNPSQPSEPEASTTQPEPTAPTWQMGIGAPIGFDTNTVVAKVFPEDDYGNGYPIALIINSKAGIEAHLSRLGYPEYLEILEAVEAYDDTFFESHSLILVWNPPGSSSDAYRVNSLHRIAEDEIEIGMCKEIPSEGAQDLVSKLIFVETSKKIPEKTVCNVNCSAHRGQKPPQVSLVDSEQVIKPRLRGYGWTNNCGSIYADGGFIGKDTNYEEEYPWLYTSQRSVLLESPVAPQKISVECWDVSNWGSDPFKTLPEKLKVENGSIPLKIGTYFYAVTVEWSAWYTDREFGRGEAYYGFVAHVSDTSVDFTEWWIPEGAYPNEWGTEPVVLKIQTVEELRAFLDTYYNGVDEAGLLEAFDEETAEEYVLYIICTPPNCKVRYHVADVIWGSDRMCIYITPGEPLEDIAVWLIATVSKDIPTEVETTVEFTSGE